MQFFLSVILVFNVFFIVSINTQEIDLGEIAKDVFSGDENVHVISDIPNPEDIKQVQHTRVSRKARVDCLLPPYPEHGKYFVQDLPHAKPGHRLGAAFLNISCHEGYRFKESEFDEFIMYCFANNHWSGEMPICERLCKLNEHSGTDYRCLVHGSGSATRACSKYESSGTIVQATCKPGFFTVNPARTMECIDGHWDRLTTCTTHSDCGMVTPEAQKTVLGRTLAKRGEMPWHVIVYEKEDDGGYTQICGGTILSPEVVISAALCFWDEDNGKNELRPVNIFGVATGKLRNKWDDNTGIDSKHAQKSNLTDIKYPPEFRANDNLYVGDIALLFLETPFKFTAYVRPACLSFDSALNNKHLAAGSLGKATTWGVDESGYREHDLKTLDVISMTNEQCRDRAPNNFKRYITGDKRCITYTNGTSVCNGDGSGGVVFPETDKDGVTRYYVRGVVSVAAADGGLDNCTTKFITYTEIAPRKSFIEQYFHYNTV